MINIKRKYPALLRKIALIMPGLIIVLSPPLYAHVGDDHSEITKSPLIKFVGIKSAYRERQPISGKIEVITNGEEDHARLEVVAFDMDQCETPEKCSNFIYKSSFKVSHNKKERHKNSFPITIPARSVAAYQLWATLTSGDDSRKKDSGSGVDHSGHQRKVIATADTGFGIRQPEMDGIPDNLLKAETPSLDSKALIYQLQSCAKSGKPIELVLSEDSKIRIQVTKQEFLGNGVTIPGIGHPVQYIGTVVNEKGEAEPESSVQLMVLNGTITGEVTRENFMRFGGSPLDHTLINPKAAYAKDAKPDEYLVYKGRHVILPLEQHGTHQVFISSNEKASSPQVKPSIVSMQAGFRQQVADVVAQLKQQLKDRKSNLLDLLVPSNAVAAPLNHEYYILPFYIYEHPINAIATNNRAAVVAQAISAFAKEFKTISPDGDPNRIVTVKGAYVAGWKSVSPNYEGVGKCQTDLDQLESLSSDPPNGPHGFHVLFTNRQDLFVDPIMGCAYPAQNYYKSTAKANRAVVKDRYANGTQSLFWSTVVVAMQEIGHTLDVHDWTGICANIFSTDPCAPHDPHTSFDISDQAGPACTSMRASYNGCSYPEAVYHWPSGNVYQNYPLQHLSNGIINLGFERSKVMNLTTPQTVSGLLTGPAKDIATNRDSVWMIAGAQAVRGGFGIYKKELDAGTNNLTGRWVKAFGAAVRIAVDPEGRPWVINSFKEIFRKQSADPALDDYELLPGQGNDIGINADGTVWLIGNDAVAGGFGIYKWNGKDWDRTPGVAAGMRVAVDKFGLPWVVNSSGVLFRKVSNVASDTVFKSIRVGSAVFDVAIGGKDDSGLPADMVAVVRGGGVISLLSLQSNNLEHLFETLANPIWQSALIATSPLNKDFSTSNAFQPVNGVAIDRDGNPWMASGAAVFAPD